MITLGIETSCDETAAAVIKDDSMLSSEVSSSVKLHEIYGGIVPEIASRFHTEYIYAVTRKALEDAGCVVGDIDIVAVTNEPGLPGSLLVGVSFAKALSFAAGIPLVEVNHLNAHIVSCFFDENGTRKKIEDIFPFIGAVVSGGHTSIYLCKSVNCFEVIGRTRDDAAGEAFDKVAKILGVGYPGGSIVEQKAKEFSEKSDLVFPKAMLQEKNDLDFSFSGLKTAVLYYWQGSARTENEKKKICFSFQNAVIGVIEKKLMRAVELTGVKKIAIGGGVINNEALRGRLMEASRKNGITLFMPPKKYCQDNAAMVASLGSYLYRGKCSNV